MPSVERESRQFRTTQKQRVAKRLKERLRGTETKICPFYKQLVYFDVEFDLGLLVRNSSVGF